MTKVVLAIFFGEFFGILGEMVAAKGRPFFGLAFGLVAWPLLVWGYWTGYKTNGIWQITATSIGTILIIEPMLIAMIFKEWPSRNELIGCLLGAAGLVIASMK
jgi:hypothetical protein